MAQTSSSKNISLREADKLSRDEKFSVWKVKMRALLRKEKLWEIIENKSVPTAFLAAFDTQRNVSENKLAEDKAAVVDAIISSVKDDIIHDIADFDDPANSWGN
ncbi:hypothetical protein KC19_VG156600 [Ceratodon purpureus]|uniref:DUF4219 domain-containing protein n=1 Tax=Ceratodon purpureus TaxID=3225 RepID=A0A8T0HRK3_CERPU|nr:hypothetical protein KC19_VG156600 [Ceratodon purpureus]